MAFEHVEGSKSRPHDKDFQSLTVERLRALLKEKGLSVKGKKVMYLILSELFKTILKLLLHLFT